MFTKTITAALAGSLLASAALADLTSNPVTNSSFTQIYDILYNPGIGMSDFSHRSAFPYPVAARPTGKTVYHRFYWKNVEPVDDEFDTSKIDEIIATAARRGQVVGLRVMSAAESPSQLPAWLETRANLSGTAGSTLTPGGKSYFFPDYDNPVIIEEAEELIAELGRRYNDNPYVYFVDVGMVGLWGEWHDGTGGTHMPTLTNSQRYIDAHATAFDHKPLVMLIGTDPVLLEYGADTYDMGWRADCFGDYRFFDASDTSGLYTIYPHQLTAAPTMNNSWQKSPVVMEACQSLRALYQNQTDADDKFEAMIDFSIENHVSSINTAWADEAIPEDLRPAFNDFLKQLGYRFVLREFTAPSIVFNTMPLEMISKWENVGNAPVYDDFRISYRLRREDGAIVRQWTTTPTIREWLPTTTPSIEVDENDAVLVNDDWYWVDTPAGDYKIDVSILWPKANEPAISLAIAGRRGDGWYEVGETKLVNMYSHPNANVLSVGNLATLKPIITAPSYTAGKNNIIDGDVNTWWHNSGSLANGWIQLDLQRTRNINRIGYLDEYARPITISVSNEAVPSTWTDVKTRCLTPGSLTVYSYCSFPKVAARHVKVRLDFATPPLDPNDVWMAPIEVQVLEVPDSL